MKHSITFALVCVLLLACNGSDGDDAAETAQTTDQQETTGASDSETGELDPVCFDNGGAYGPCSSAMCSCVLGGDVYQYCTKPCTQASDCGEASEFPGATPECAPVNPGDTNMICVLRCQTSSDCPCGLECEPTYLICSEPQN